MIIISVLANIWSMMPAYSNFDPQSASLQALSDWWAVSSVFMGIVMAFWLKSKLEALYGVIMYFIIWMHPPFGVFFGIGFFAWSFYKIEEARINKLNP